MPKGVTNAIRIVLTDAEYVMLRNNGRLFDRPRVTRNNLANFRLSREDLRDEAVTGLRVFELTNV